MRGFWMKLGAFLLPFVVAVGLLSGTMLYIGESLPLAAVVAIQQSSDAPVIYRPQFGNRDLPYKQLSVAARQPEVIALGSSRVLQLRAGLFTENPAAFYNAGAPAWGLPQARALLEGLAHTPRVVILGIDPPWFNPAYAGDVSAGVTLNPPNDFQQIFAINRAVMQAVFSGRAPDWADLLTRRVLPGGAPESGDPALGLKAIQNGHGFRPDGSEQYGDFLIGRFLDPATERERHLGWMRRGEQMYVYGGAGDLSEAALDDLAGLLAWCAARGITVIGFSPPYAPALYDRMTARGDHAYIEALNARLPALFAAHDFAYFDFSDGAAFGDDADFYDGWHGGERVYLRAFMALLDGAPDALGAYANGDALRAIEAAAGDPWRVFE